MTKKERTASESLNVELSKLDALLLVMQGRNPLKEFSPLINQARQAVERASDHLITIRFHASQI